MILFFFFPKPLFFYTYNKQQIVSEIDNFSFLII